MMVQEIHEFMTMQMLMKAFESLKVRSGNMYWLM